MTALSPPPQTRTIGTALIAGKPVAVQADIAWFRYWAQGVYDRIGGATGSSNAELSALIDAAQADADAAASAVAALGVRTTAVESDVVDLLADVAAIQSDLTALTARVTAIEAEAMPKALQYDQIDATTAYRGEAEPGTLTSEAGWRVQKLIFGVDGDISGTWADGSIDMTQVWDDRLTLAYS